ncbi:MAG: hypothetical protein AAF530_18185 [Pseudomonadota bacterium]
MNNWPVQKASSLTLGLILVFLAMLPGAVLAQVNSLEPFLGRWSGVALTEHYQEPGLFGYVQRDLDVDIERIEGGFAITWITEIHGDKEAATKRRETTMAFHLVEPGLFEAVNFSQVNESGSPFGVRYSWARIDNGPQGKSPKLMISVLEIDRGGVADLSHYVRAIDAAGQMDLEYIRDRDGRRLRRVTGKLIPERQ